ncbi:hypothetical protein [Ruminococcus bicirculans (ex Wegman et al. 2014)]|uniref:hypothetical protein n=1 Tax=Ruminococcus bicirculans (ex Wegman et al. 2014) TaxID=1160721 RepID=UPI0022E2B58F|nr:hypothetical protein [Ruminococcus bicirculans (ex Wegman et al. 2014)]
MIQKQNIINREHYDSVIYLSHPYGGKQENLSEINECQRLLTIMHPENLYLNPIAMFGNLYDCTTYEQGLNMTLFLLEELADRMVICSDNYMYSKGCLAEIAYCSEREIPYKYLTLSQIKKEYEKYIKEHSRNG